MDDLSGQVLRGYELRQRIGGGGFGTVYRAYQSGVQREVAVKIIHPWLAHDPSFHRRFEAEALFIARLEHPYVVPLYDYWRSPGAAYLVMRWLRGGSLRQKLKQSPLAVEQVAKLLPQVASALAFAHRHHIIHRDLKPDNILLDEEGNAYLTDFGIAKDLTAKQTDTPAGEVMGTPDYLAPEQFLGDPPTPQTDIYSLGLVLYELLTGKLPYGKLPQKDLAQKRLNEPVPMLSQHCPDLPDSLNEVIQWATRRDPSDRCADAIALADAFQIALESTPAALKSPAPADDHKETGPTLIITSIPVSDLKARFYQNAELILEKPRRLIGRDALRARIHQLLDDGERVLLSGMGGMGKTSLAATLADERIAAGRGPVIWLEAGSESADRLFEALARTFDRQQEVARKSGNERITAVRELLLEKKALLVLDNVWNERALFQVQKAIPPSLPLLATSRHIMPLDGVVIEVNELDADGALELLAHHARRDFSADANARALCLRLGNHPFALEIAGKRLKVDADLKPAQLLESIADAPHALKLPQAFADVGREGIKELLDESVNELPPDSYSAFVAMGGMFAPQATLDLFALVLGCEQSAVETVIADLQQRGLVERITPADRHPAHYRLHDLTYSYARVLFINAGRNYQPVIEAVQNFITAHAEDYDDLDFEQLNILGAANAARRLGNTDALIHIIKVLAVDGEYFGARGHSPQSLELLQAAIGAAKAAEQLESAHFLLSKLGNYYRDFLADYHHAFASYNEALTLAQTLENLQREAILLTTIGTVRALQNAQDVDSYHSEAERIARECNDKLALGMILTNRGIYMKTKQVPDYEAGRKLFDEAAQIGAFLDSPQIRFFALLNRGDCEHELAQIEQALDTHLEAYQLADKYNNHLWMAHALRDRGDDYHALGKKELAQQCFEQALALMTRCGAATESSSLLTFMTEKGYNAPNENHDKFNGD
jgi:serine/threonine protein kinase